MYKRTDHAKLMYIRTTTAEALGVIIAYTSPDERGRHLYALALTYKDRPPADQPPKAVGDPTTLMQIRAEERDMLDAILDHTTPDERGRHLHALALTRAQGQATQPQTTETPAIPSATVV